MSVQRRTYQREIVTQLVERWLRTREVLGLIPWPTILTEVFPGFFLSHIRYLRKYDLENSFPHPLP